MMRRRATAAALALLVASTAAAGCSHSAGNGPPSRTQIAAALGAHGRAVQSGNRAAFLAGVSTAPAAQAFRQRQAGEFANLRRLPIARWWYTLGPRAQAPDAQQGARRRFGPSAVVYRVSLHYQLHGIDAVPTSQFLYWTFVRGGSGAVAVDDSALEDVGGPSWRGPWDFGPLTVVRGRHCLVLGHPGTATLLHTLARTVDSAVPVVSSVWGTDWSRDVLVLVPTGAAELRADLGPAADDAAPVIAAAASDGTDPRTGAALGQRLVVDPRKLHGVSPVGLRIVLQHEITHIAAAGATTEATPTWLTEGFAEYVGNLGSGQPVRVAAQELAAALRRGGVPRRLPGSGAFTGSAAAVAYEGAWLACRMFAQRFGQSALVRFYREVGHAESDTPLATALHDTAHETLARFTAQWRRYLREQLGVAG